MFTSEAVQISLLNAKPEIFKILPDMFQAEVFRKRGQCGGTL